MGCKLIQNSNVFAVCVLHKKKVYTEYMRLIENRGIENWSDSPAQENDCRDIDTLDENIRNYYSNIDKEIIYG